jgi:hypothetical protein
MKPDRKGTLHKTTNNRDRAQPSAGGSKARPIDCCAPPPTAPAAHILTKALEKLG